MTTTIAGLPAATPASTATVLVVEGMTCGACAHRIERTLSGIDGVQARVNYATQRATVEHDAGIAVADLVAVVEQAGYTARPPAGVETMIVDGVVEGVVDSRVDEPAAEAGTTELGALRVRVIASVALALPVVVLSMLPVAQFPQWQWLALGLTLPVVGWGGLPFHRKAFVNLKHGFASMDTLVSVGTLAALGWSLYAMLFGRGAGNLTHGFDFDLVPRDATAQIYLEVAAGITAFVLAGRYAEARARRRSGAALRGLLTMAATQAVVRRDGQDVLVPTDQLAVGDVFVVTQGDKIATDGTVVQGSAALDASMITGEAGPVDVEAGDAVVGGCIAASGWVLVRAGRVGADTQLAQMAAAVERAQSGKAAVQRLADRVCGWFVPVVLVIAAATVGFWIGTGNPSTGVAAAVAVLIVACPCALGLATPTALLVGTGRAAQLGILVSGPEVLESVRRIDTVVLDKTGTITTGVMSVVDVVLADGEGVTDVLAVAGALECMSHHPVAVAITRYAAEHSPFWPAMTDIVSLDGLGIAGDTGARDASIGAPGLMRERGIELPEPLQGACTAATERGRTTVVLAWDGRARAVVVVADSVRPTSADAVRELRALGLEPVLLTGDNAGAARVVADAVGITRVIADALPTEKVDVVKQLQDEGHVVAMVGDGVNDAAALAQADLGMAMGSGTDIAIAASDLTLVRTDLRATVDAVRLSRRTLRIIKGNVTWAFGYNVLALPVAAAGMLHPMLAAAAMAGSSLIVVSNSLRLRS